MRPKVESVAARLADATGAEVRREEVPGGARLEVDVPRELSESARRAVVAAIASGDINSTLVGTCLLTPEVRRRRRRAGQFAEAS